MIPEVNMLLLNYQNLNIEENFTTTEWITDSEGDCDTFILQGFTLSTIESENLAVPDFIIALDNLNSATISSDQYINSAGDPILYRLISVDENGNICSNRIDQERFYRFHGTLIVLY